MSGVITYVFFMFYLFFKNKDQAFVDIAINIVKLAPTFIAIFSLIWVFVFLFFIAVFRKLGKIYMWNDKEMYFWISLLSIIIGCSAGIVNFMMQGDFFKAFIIFASIVFGSVFSTSVYFEMKKNG